MLCLGCELGPWYGPARPDIVVGSSRAGPGVPNGQLYCRLCVLFRFSGPGMSVSAQYNTIEYKTVNIFLFPSSLVHPVACHFGVLVRDGSGSGLVRVSAGFGFSGFGFGVGFSPTVFRFGFRFGFGFWFPPVDIQWISEINHLELKLMIYNMLMITCLLRLLNLLKVDS